MDFESLRMQYVPVVFFDPGYALEDHHDGAPFGAHVDGLKRRIQD
jgi:hypothetical protein